KAHPETEHIKRDPEASEAASSLIVPFATLTTRRKRPARRLAVAMDAIVLASFLRIRQDLVRLLNVHEPPSGPLIPPHVLMVSEREPRERRLDRPIVGSRADPQDAVIILDGFHRAPELRGRGRLPRRGRKPRAIRTGELAFMGRPCLRDRLGKFLPGQIGEKP